MTFLLIETALFLQLDHDYDVVDVDDHDYDYDVVDVDDDDSPVTCKRQVASDLLAHTKNRRKKIIFGGTFSLRLLHKTNKPFLTSSTNTHVYNDDDDEDDSCNLQEASSI